MAVGPCDCIGQCGLLLLPQVDYLPPIMDKPSISHSALCSYHSQKISRIFAEILASVGFANILIGIQECGLESGVTGIQCGSLLQFVTPMFLFQPDVSAPVFVTAKYRAFYLTLLIQVSFESAQWRKVKQKQPL